MSVKLQPIVLLLVLILLPVTVMSQEFPLPEAFERPLPAAAGGSRAFITIADGTGAHVYGLTREMVRVSSNSMDLKLEDLTEFSLAGTGGSGRRVWLLAFDAAALTGASAQQARLLAAELLADKVGPGDAVYVYRAVGGRLLRLSAREGLPGRADSMFEAALLPAPLTLGPDDLYPLASNNAAEVAFHTLEQTLDRLHARTLGRYEHTAAILFTDSNALQLLREQASPAIESPATAESRNARLQWQSAGRQKENPWRTPLFLVDLAAASGTDPAESAESEGSAFPADMLHLLADRLNESGGGLIGGQMEQLTRQLNALAGPGYRLTFSNRVEAGGRKIALSVSWDGGSTTVSAHLLSNVLQLPSLAEEGRSEAMVLPGLVPAGMDLQVQQRLLAMPFRFFGGYFSLLEFSADPVVESSRESAEYERIVLAAAVENDETTFTYRSHKHFFRRDPDSTAQHYRLFEAYPLAVAEQDQYIQWFVQDVDRRSFYTAQFDLTPMRDVFLSDRPALSQLAFLMPFASGNMSDWLNAEIDDGIDMPREPAPVLVPPGRIPLIDQVEQAAWVTVFFMVGDLPFGFDREEDNDWILRYIVDTPSRRFLVLPRTQRLVPGGGRGQMAVLAELPLGFLPAERAILTIEVKRLQWVESMVLRQPFALFPFDQQRGDRLVADSDDIVEIPRPGGQIAEDENASQSSER